MNTTIAISLLSFGYLSLSLTICTCCYLLVIFHYLSLSHCYLLAIFRCSSLSFTIFCNFLLSLAIVWLSFGYLSLSSAIFAIFWLSFAIFHYLLLYFTISSMSSLTYFTMFYYILLCFTVFYYIFYVENFDNNTNTSVSGDLTIITIVSEKL